MLYIPESDSCTVWTANNTPLQRDSETLYWFPSSANIDCWQVQSSHDGDTSAWQDLNNEKWTRNGCSVKVHRRLFGEGDSCRKCKSRLCQSMQGSHAHSLPPPDATDGLLWPKTSVVGAGGTSGRENPEWIGSCRLRPSPPTPVTVYFFERKRARCKNAPIMWITLIIMCYLSLSLRFLDFIFLVFFFWQCKRTFAKLVFSWIPICNIFLCKRKCFDNSFNNILIHP